MYRAGQGGVDRPADARGVETNDMPYVTASYKNHPSAPPGMWTCAPTSKRQPSSEPPSSAQTKGPEFCGQCVSYVKQVCPTLPPTGSWKRGALVRGNTGILRGTVIATFSATGTYEGHAAIYDGQLTTGINVWDQWVTPPTPKSVGPRLLRWGAQGRANNGDNFYVVE